MQMCLLLPRTSLYLSDYDALLEETQFGNENENMSYDMAYFGILPDKPICEYI